MSRTSSALVFALLLLGSLAVCAAERGEEREGSRTRRWQERERKVGRGASVNALGEWLMNGCPSALNMPAVLRPGDSQGKYERAPPPRDPT